MGFHFSLSQFVASSLSCFPSTPALVPILICQGMFWSLCHLWNAAVGSPSRSLAADHPPSFWAKSSFALAACAPAISRWVLARAACSPFSPRSATITFFAAFRLPRPWFLPTFCPMCGTFAIDPAVVGCPLAAASIGFIPRLFPSSSARACFGHFAIFGMQLLVLRVGL